MKDIAGTVYYVKSLLVRGFYLFVLYMTCNSPKLISVYAFKKSLKFEGA